MININIFEIKQAVFEFNAKYREKHGEQLDWGSCGYGLPMIGFGRKQKLKKELIAAGVLKDESWDLYGKKFYLVNTDAFRVENDCGVQAYGYNTSRMDVITNKLRDQLADQGAEGIEVYNHTWVD